jgi:hypothetical protein
MLWHRISEPWRRTLHGCAALPFLGSLDLRRTGG